MIRRFSMQLRNWLTRERWGIALLTGTWLVFFSRLLSGQYVYFLDDLKIIYYPLEVVYATFQHSWSLPLWSPLFGFGQPLIAWGQLGFFTPLHLLLRALYVSPLQLLQISVMAYYGLGLLGGYLFLRYLKLGQAASALGALVYVFSGFHIGHLNHVNFYTTTMLLPWLLLAVSALLGTPTLRRSAFVAFVGGAMALSGQPQVVTYAFAIAAAVTLALATAQLVNRGSDWLPYLKKLVALLVLAGILAFCLASFAILPLLEFLPLTERSGGLDPQLLYEFSYPPRHAITLLLPYVFGDHTTYWGAKGFQELAAFTGIIPLALASLMLLPGGPRGRAAHQALRIVGIVLVTLGIAITLGKYSPLYHWLVEQHIITSLSIPGRFVFFFNTGVALLAALALDTLPRRLDSRLLERLPWLLASLLGPALLVLPFVFALPGWPRAAASVIESMRIANPSWFLLVAGLVLYVTVFLLPKLPARQLWLAGGAALTLVALAWNYNPVTPRARAFQEPQFAQELRQAAADTAVPPRFYSQKQLIIDREQVITYASPEISPNFTVWQPVTITESAPYCFRMSFSQLPDGGRAVTVGLHDGVGEPPLAELAITADDLLLSPDQSFCFTDIATTPAQPLLSWRSEEPSGITVPLRRLPADQRSAYILRVDDPTPEQWERSHKALTVPVVPDVVSSVDPERELLARHLQVAAGGSGARWIGALSIKPYREFSETFFANDREPFNSDGRHVLDTYRHLFDMLGVDYLAQQLPVAASDRMPDAGFTPLRDFTVGETTFRLYQNPEAFPRAFLVGAAISQPVADEARSLLLDPTFDPTRVAIIGGPKPPEDIPSDPNELSAQALQPVSGSAQITTYEPTKVVVSTDTAQESWLIISDTTTPEWRTTIDGELVPHYSAYTFLKAARVPAGKHTVTFTYASPAIAQASWLTGSSILVLIGLLLYPSIRTFRRTRHSTSPPAR